LTASSFGPEQFGERQPYSGERNLLVFGPNGSGKGTRFLMPNLLQMRDGLVTSAAGLPSLTCSRTIRDDQNQIGRSGAADNACGIA
jgi:hypothetical protein